MQKTAIAALAGVTALAIGAGSYAIFRANAPKSYTTRTVVQKTITPGEQPKYDLQNLSANAPAAPTVTAHGYNSVPASNLPQSTLSPAGTVPSGNVAVNSGQYGAPASTQTTPTISTTPQQSQSFYSRLDKETPVPATQLQAVGTANTQSRTSNRSEQNGSNTTVTETRTSKTAYATPTTSTTHYASVRRQVKHRKSGNVHVGRAVKHTIAFTAKLPGRLRL